MMKGLDSEIQGAGPPAPDEADKLSLDNIAEIDAQWAGVVAEYRAGSSLAEQRDAGVRRELEGIARLFIAVTGGSNDPDSVWWTFLDSKGIRRGKRRGRDLLFYGLIEHLSNEYGGQDETRTKSVISRRAAVLQYWHNRERLKVPADQVADWIATNGGIKAIAAIANPAKKRMTADDRNAALEGNEWFQQLVQCEALASMQWDPLPDNLRPFADAKPRLALIRVRNEGADILCMGSVVSQRWLNKNAQSLVQRQNANGRDSEPAADSDEKSLLSKIGRGTVH